MALSALQRITTRLSAVLVLLLLCLPSGYAQINVIGPVNCTETDDRLPTTWRCESSSFCLSINQGLNAYCCPIDRACAQLPQFDCDPKNSPWVDRVWTYTKNNPKKGCGNGVCCPVGYDCINGATRDESNCLLLLADAKYPAGVDPDDPQRCINECRAKDPCCPDRCRGKTCTTTTTSIPPSSSSSQSPSSETAAISTVTEHHTEHHTAIPKASPPSSPTANPATATISGGKLAGIIVGCVLGVALLALGMWLLFKKRKSPATAQSNTTPDQDGPSLSPNPDPRSFFPEIPPGVRGAWAPPRPPRSYLDNFDDPTSPLKSDARPGSPGQAGADNSGHSGADYIKPFFLNEGTTTPAPKPARAPSSVRSPTPAVASPEREGSTLVGSVAAPSITEAPAQPLARSSDDGGHGIDPNGSEAYEMTRWGKAIKQTNVD